MNDSDEPLDPLRRVTIPVPDVAKLRKHLRPAIVSVISLTLLTGCIFPLVLFALGRLLYPGEAVGSPVTGDGVC